MYKKLFWRLSRPLCKCLVTWKLGNSCVLNHRTMSLSLVKICIKIGFELFLNIKYELRKIWEFLSLNFGDVIWKPTIIANLRALSSTFSILPRFYFLLGNYTLKTYISKDLFRALKAFASWNIHPPIITKLFLLFTWNCVEQLALEKGTQSKF